jgi:endonuclease III
MNKQATGVRPTDWEAVFSIIKGSVDKNPLPSVSQVADINRDPFKILISTMISLRTKDEVTTEAAKRLFATAETPGEMAKLTEETIAELIYPAGFYRNKARNIKKVATRLSISATPYTASTTAAGPSESPAAQHHAPDSSSATAAENQAPESASAMGTGRLEDRAAEGKGQADSAAEEGRVPISPVPSTREELLALPGVGRKTANLVLSLGFGIDAICVDTHVHRICNRLGWVETRTPEETEYALMDILPRTYWITINELMVSFGQKVCTPQSPFCSRCGLREHYCGQVGVTRSR